jgi:hypothetical protein
MLVATNETRPTMPIPKQGTGLFGQNPQQLEKKPQATIFAPSTGSHDKHHTNTPAEKKPVMDLSISIIPRDRKNGKHLVLDLDETLVHTFDAKDDLASFANQLTPEQRKRIYMIDFPGGDTLWGYVRPYVEDFLKVAFNEFESVGVWSAGTQYYVTNIVQVVFKDQSPKFVMSRNQCNELKIKTEEIPCRFKPLEVIYHTYPDHNPTNTVIVDDRHDICALNCMNNIRIPEFIIHSQNHYTMVNDITMLTLARWFQTEEFRGASDVRLVKSRSPFKI